MCTEIIEEIPDRSPGPSLRHLAAAPLLDEISSSLASHRDGPGVQRFLELCQQTGVGSLLSSNTSYTVLAPLDSAFRAWAPIDWGFDPFRVEDFSLKVLKKHFIPEVIDVFMEDDQFSR